MRAGRPGGIGHPHAIGFAVLGILVSTLCASCGEAYPASTARGVLVEGREERTSVAFAMNGRPVRLELLIRIEGTGATVEVDHPDGRSTETIEVAGPGIRELCKEFPKEPGSWGLRLVARGGSSAYWVVLHDRKRYLGPDEDARRFVESD
jgi:hypothetical protein